MKTDATVHEPSSIMNPRQKVRLCVLLTVVALPSSDCLGQSGFEGFLSARDEVPSHFRLFAGEATASLSDDGARSQWTLGLQQLVGSSVEPDLEPGLDSDPSGIQDPLRREGDDPQRRIVVRLGLDLRDLVTSPLRASRRDWAKVGIGVGLVGVASLLDDELRAILEPGDKSRLAHSIRPISEELGLLALATTWAIGAKTGNRQAVVIGQDGLEAVILAAGVVAPLAKLLTGRERPRAELGKQAFSGMGRSFPSGEVTLSFAMASVISAHSRQKWLKAAAWTMAAATAWQRAELDGHWASDITAGALVGAGIGRWVVRRNNRMRGWTWEPSIGSDGGSLTVRRSF